MPKYAVCSPFYSATMPILEDGSGPLEETCDYIEVEAETPRQAKVFAVRAWRALNTKNRHEAEWIANQRSNGASPFTGLKVEVANAVERLGGPDGE